MTNDAPAQASVEAAVQAMENDPFWQDASLAGTTQQDQRIRHYAEVAVSALSPPPTVGAEDEAEVTRIRDWLLERNREHLYEKGLMLRRHAGDAEMFLDAAILLSKLATRPSPSAMEVKGLEWSEIEHDRGDGQTDRTGEWEAPSIVGVYAINISTCGDMHAPWEVFGGDDSKLGNFATLDEAKASAQADYEQRIRSCIASEKGGA